MTSKMINVFGYGSLINLKSLAKTIGREVKSSEVIPIELAGYKQFWGISALLSYADGDYDTLFLNLIADKNSKAYGVVIKVSEDEFERLIKREKGYEILSLNGYKEPLFAFGATKKQEVCGVIPSRYIKVIQDGLKKYNYPAKFKENFQKAVLENLPFPQKDGVYRDFLSTKIKALFKSPVGIEKESLRVSKDGEFSQIPHHKSFGSPSQNPYIKMDFAENQLEFITPPCESSDEVINYLKATHQIAANLYKDEFFWPFSTPAKISNIKIAQFDDAEALNYRKYLIKKYGKEPQLICGIHYNFSLASSLAKHFSPRLKDTFYLKLARNYLKYRYILTYLYGASPYISKDYPNSNLIKIPLKSIRQSSFGYKNPSEISVSYLTFERYKNDIANAVNSGELISPKELYKPVRLKFDGEHISYLEFRNFDLNPFAPYGILKDDLDFIKLFIIAMLLIDEDDEYSEALGDKLSLEVANSSQISPCPNPQKATKILEFMLKISSNLKDTNLKNTIKEKLKMISNPAKTLSAKITQICKNLDEFSEFGLDLARKHKELYLQRGYNLHGFEGLEISTQDLLKNAISYGVSVEIIDKKDNLLKLSYGGKSEFVKNANMSSKDSLISYFLMENKVATKAILNKAGIKIPDGKSFESLEDALEYYEMFESFVIKPKSTNYGLGITIFEKRPSFGEFENALNLAFKEDSSVIIEEFVSGDELRFYVQDGVVLAVCKREPANVIGDGKSTISQLIDKENLNPLRGENHKTPLIKIKKGELERLELALQNLSFDSILAKDQKARLRRNSNISTGGIAYDLTDEVDEFYKSVATKVAHSLGAKVCGVDIIIKDYKKHGDYAVIEANFNPAMLIHLFGVGKKRELGKAFLGFLFDDLKIYE
ncbi:MAG: bifunctional glutamate--cysteine ligase GshA/glutathione synthetase GshB [Campylobacter sp.]|nr:bifunctional glutamate--cysteine ligase GshA/glutathione synthetase GshB [Campylobacter sp.]